MLHKKLFVLPFYVILFVIASSPNSFSQCPDCFSFLVPPIFEDPVVSPNGILDTSFMYVLCGGGSQITVDSIRTKSSSWLQILSYSDSIFITECDTGKIGTVYIRFDATGLTPYTYVDTIIVFSTSSNQPRATLPVHLVVTDCGYFRKSQVVATQGDLRVNFANTSNLSDQDLLNGFYLTSINKNFLFDGSAVVTTVTADGDTIALMDINAVTPVHALSGIDTHFVNLSDSISFAQALQQQRPARGGDWLKIGPAYDAMFLPNISPECPWPGPWFKYWICQSWWIKVQPKPRYVIWFTKLYRADPPCWWPLWPGELLVNKIYAGSVLDWDVPSDTGGVLNHWGNNDTLKFVWLQGNGPNSDKFFAATAAIADTFVHIGNPNGFWSAKVHRNAEFFPDDPKVIYRVISDSGFNPKDTLVDSLAFTPADRHIQFASICFDPIADTVAYCQALVVSDSGYDALKNSIFRARSEMMGNEFLGCDGGVKAGDVNGDGKLTLSDVIMLVNYIFKGGTKPNPACSGDVNYDGNITLTDIVFLVNHIFKGGPRPPSHPWDICCL